MDVENSRWKKVRTGWKDAGAWKKYENGATNYSNSLGANCIASTTIVLALGLKLYGPFHSVIEFASLSLSALEVTLPSFTIKIRGLSLSARSLCYSVVRAASFIEIAGLSLSDSNIAGRSVRGDQPVVESEGQEEREGEKEGRRRRRDGRERGEGGERAG
jgi:hypothetical protein